MIQPRGKYRNFTGPGSNFVVTQYSPGLDNCRSKKPVIRRRIVWSQVSSVTGLFENDVSIQTRSMTVTITITRVKLINGDVQRQRVGIGKYCV